ADLVRGGFRAGLVPAGDDHVAAACGVRLRKLAAKSLRTADDDDIPCGHWLSPFRAESREGPSVPPADRAPGIVTLDGCHRLGRPLRQQCASRQDVIPGLLELPDDAVEVDVDEPSV